MTYPPQQPGPYGQGPYGQQPPGPYGHQSSYQGLGGFPGSGPGGFPGGPGGVPPKKSNTRMIIAVVVVAVLVVGGAGTAIFLLIKGGDNKSNTATDNTPKATGAGTKPSDDREPSDKSTPSSKRTGSNGEQASGPTEVQQAYINAYESKDFDPVVNSACKAYKEKFGTDTTKLEDQLAPFDIKATADGEPEMSGSSALAKIDLELTKGSETKAAKIKIKIVKESGEWKFCGEDEA